jgi:hypothetical protein
METLDQMDRAIAAKQTHCYTCGNPLPKHKIECPICREWQCTRTCLNIHLKKMDAI